MLNIWGLSWGRGLLEMFMIVKIVVKVVFNYKFYFRQRKRLNFNQNFYTSLLYKKKKIGFGVQEREGGFCDQLWLPFSVAFNSIDRSNKEECWQESAYKPASKQQKEKTNSVFFLEGGGGRKGKDGQRRRGQWFINKTAVGFIINTSSFLPATYNFSVALSIDDFQNDNNFERERIKMRAMKGKRVTFA